MTDESTTETDAPNEHERARNAGERTGAGLATAARLGWMPFDGVKIFLQSMLMGFLAKIPKIGPGIANGLINAGHKMQLNNDDVVCNVIYPDGVVATKPASWQSKKNAFETADEELFYAKGVGYDPKRLNGKIPVVWALRSGSEITEPLEAAIGVAQKLGRFEPFTRANGDKDVAVDIDPNGFDAGPGIKAPGEQMRADGGVTAGPQAAANTGSAEYDGSVLSFRDGYELFGNKVDQEELQQAETRGKLAALNVRDLGSNWKYMLLLLASFLAGLLGPSLAERIAGASGDAVGGGADIVPLAVQGLTLVPGVVV